MSLTVDIAFVNEFSNTVLHLAASNPTMFRSAVKNKPGAVRGKTYAVERLGSIDFAPVTSRHAQTNMTYLTHSRRRLTIADASVAELIDDLDEVKMLISPQSDYAQRFAEAWNRKIAVTCMLAALGNSQAQAADESTSNIALPSSQAIANGSAGMTMSKLRQAGRIMTEAGIPLDNRWIAMNGFAVEDLLADSTFTSSDYMTLNALTNGTIPPGAMVMGFHTMIVTDALERGDEAGGAITRQTTAATQIMPMSCNIRSCVAWHRDSIVLGVAKEFNVEMARRWDLNGSLQILALVALGAVRVEDYGVVKIDIDQTA